jgi:ribosomal protein L31E
MAEKTVEEKIITVNLRKGLKESPRWNRARKATANLRNILRRHTKAEKIKIDKKVNEAIWRKSIERPAHKLRLKITKTDAKTAKVELLEK